MKNYLHYVHKYTNLLNLRATCGSAEQPLPSPIEKGSESAQTTLQIELCEGIM